MSKPKIRSVKFNFIMNTILMTSSFIFPLITFPYVSRTLLVEGNGKVAFAISVLSYFSMFASLGIPSYGIRACAQVRDDRRKLTKVTQELLIINSITTIITYIAFFVSLFIVPRFTEDRTLLLINSVSLVLNSIGVNWLYSALEQYAYITVRNMIFKIISIILMFVLVHRESDYIVYGAITVAAASGSNILNFFNLRKFVDLKPIRHYNFRRHVKPIFIFFATSAAISIYTNLDTVMLGFMTTNTQVGIYNASIKIKSVLVSAVTSLGTVLLPRLSYYVRNHMEQEFNNLIRKAFNFILIFAVPLSVYFFIFAKQSVLLLSGEPFLDAVLPMQILMPTLVFIGLSNITGMQILVPYGREFCVLISVIAGAVLDFVINLLLIPYWGATGTAVSTLLAEFLVLVLQLSSLRGKLKGLWKTLSIRHTLVGMIFPIGFSILIQLKVSMRPFLILLISACVFFMTFYVGLLIQKEPFIMDIVKSALQKIHHKKRRKINAKI